MSSKPKKHVADRLGQNVAIYNIAILDAILTCQNILSQHDHSKPYVLLEEKLIGELRGLKRAAHE
jgi:hypothetical protein